MTKDLHRPASGFPATAKPLTDGKDNKVTQNNHNSASAEPRQSLTLDSLVNQPPTVLDALPIDLLANLKAEAEAHLASASQMVAIIHGIFERRYAAGLNATGTHHRQDGEYDIKITVPKRVEWDQAKLAPAVETIKGWGENPAEYVETKITVQERKFDAWPSAIRDLFEPARTVKTGKPQFAVALAKREAA